MTDQRKAEVDVMPWVIKAGDDGILKDCVLVAVMDGEEMQSVQLYVATPPSEEPK